MTAKAETVDATRERLLAAGRPWTVCRGCDRPLDRHARRKIPNTGTDEYTCPRTGSGRYEPLTLPELDYNPQKGLHRP